MNNQTLGPCEVIIYDLLVRRDTSRDPTQAFQDGCSTLATMSGSSLDSSLYGVDPMMSPVFRRAFKIAKRTVVNMAGGAVHRHDVKIDYNKIVPGEINDTSKFEQWLTGWSYCCMIVARGYPGYDTTNAKVTPLPVNIYYCYNATEVFNCVVAPNLRVETATGVTAGLPTDNWKYVEHTGEQIVSGIVS